MKEVMISGYNFRMLKLAENALKNYCRISHLPENKIQEYLENNQVDLILLVVAKEDTNCFSIVDRLQKIPDMMGKPVIFFAEQSNLAMEQEAISKGVQDYISMPISEELFRHRISTCIELMELRSQRPFVQRYQDAISSSFAELVECRDVTTGGHMKNTRRYFQILLEEAMSNEHYRDRLPVEDIRDLLRSVTLHDIGKIGINDEILRKSSTLDDNEYEYMKTHTILGKKAFDKIIKETGGTRWLYLARDMAYSHHERWNGTGYPQGLMGEEIPYYARMLAIVDVYDALTSNRSYKEAFSHQRAMDIITEGKGSLFDPDLVDLFIIANKKFEAALGKIQEKE